MSLYDPELWENPHEDHPLSVTVDVTALEARLAALEKRLAALEAAHPWRKRTKGDRRYPDW